MNVQFVTEIDFKSEYNNPSSLQYKSLKKDIQIQVSSNPMHSLTWPGSYTVSVCKLKILFEFGYMCVTLIYLSL